MRKNKMSNVCLLEQDLSPLRCLLSFCNVKVLNNLAMFLNKISNFLWKKKL